MAAPAVSRAAPPGHPLQKRTVVQWDIGAVLSVDGAADESVPPQAGIRMQMIEEILEGVARDYPSEFIDDQPSLALLSTSGLP
jgi:hypothetical protein